MGNQTASASLSGSVTTKGVTGDVKRLSNYSPEYRLRVGDWRVLFNVVDDTISIERIAHRSDAY